MEKKIIVVKEIVEDVELRVPWMCKTRNGTVKSFESAKLERAKAVEDHRRCIFTMTYFLFDGPVTVTAEKYVPPSA